ncbi:MFS transporter [Alicyclobacillus fastidiosus]|uniref:MFS transporter n=1 Tax=Alicyclobacillus fastidiosus TaxID=392011 RepID=UPI0034DCD474
MIVSVLSSCICSLLTAFCLNWTSFLIARTLLGVLVSGLPATAMAYLSEEMNPKVLGFSMGLFISGNTVGGLLGRVLVSFLTEFSSWRMAVAVISGLGLLMGIFFSLNLPTSKHFGAKKNPTKVVCDPVSRPRSGIHSAVAPERSPTYPTVQK